MKRNELPQIAARVMRRKIFTESISEVDLSTAELYLKEIDEKRILI